MNEVTPLGTKNIFISMLYDYGVIGCVLLIIIAVYWYDNILPSKQPNNPHFREVNTEPFQGGQSPVPGCCFLLSFTGWLMHWNLPDGLL